jgi:signal transduction histidine kinase
MNPSKLFSRQPTVWIFGEMALLVLVIGFIDFATGYEISFFIFYGMPIFTVAWFCDKKLAILTALFAGITWWWADIESGHYYHYTWIEIWETTMRLGFFLLVAIAGAGLKSKNNVAAARIALLEHSQRLEREIIGISEREQRRIGQDLHDGLCQYLAALGCAAVSLRGDLVKLKLSAEADVADELAKLLQDAVVQTRDLARGLVPVPMDEAGLVSALETLALSVTRLQGINCTFETEGSPHGYEEKSAMHLYRVAQEAVNNATKHGKARNICLSLTAAQGQTTLCIADDGRGFARSEPSTGMGLNIMNYRARLIGGDLQIMQRKNGGTVVSCTIPQTNPTAHANAA